MHTSVTTYILLISRFIAGCISMLDKVDTLPYNKTVMSLDIKMEMIREGYRMATIRELRIQRLISQVNLAKEAGIAVYTVVKMEQGKPTKKETLEKVCKVLDVSPEDVEGVYIFEPIRDRKRR